MNNLYRAIEENLKLISFSDIFEGFKPSPFALYDDSTCILDGKTIDRPSNFHGNTAITYNGINVAIWDYRTASQDPKKMTSLIVHEMYHAFQKNQLDKRHGNEVDGLFYNYDELNLSMKAIENNFLVRSITENDKQLFEEFKQVRSNRYNLFPSEVEYEIGIESIEGTARYVELQVLRQLDKNKYELEFQKLLEEMENVESLLKVREISYEIGCLLMYAYKKFENNYNKYFYSSSKLFEVKPPTDKVYELRDDVTKSITENKRKTKAKEIELLHYEYEDVPFDKILGWNPMGYLMTSKYLFVNYLVIIEVEDESKMLEGNFVLEHKNREFISLKKQVNI